MHAMLARMKHLLLTLKNKIRLEYPRNLSQTQLKKRKFIGAEKDGHIFSSYFSFFSSFISVRLIIPYRYSVYCVITGIMKQTVLERLHCSYP